MGPSSKQTCVSPFHRLSPGGDCLGVGKYSYDLSIHVMQAGKSNWGLETPWGH